MGRNDAGSKRPDAIRLHRIEAMRRRAAGQEGEARRLLEGRLSEMIAAHAADFELAASAATAAESTAAPATPARGAMGELNDYIAAQAAMRDGHSTTGDAAPPRSFPELAVLDDFRKIWSRIRTESQLRQSLEQAPANAGPLNSGKLVHRSLTLMSELSPGYLEQFLSYLDALTWIEQMNEDGVLAAEETPRVAATGKRSRARPRARRE